MGDTIGIIQARIGSARLPAKILAPLAGRPLLELLVSRLQGARVAEWWLATTQDPADDVTTAWGHSLGLPVYRGGAEDVLSRFVAIAGERQPEWIVRVTADNPFLDAAAVNLLVDGRDVAKDADLIELGPQRTLPLGYAAQLARAEALVDSADRIPSDRAHHRSHVVSFLAASGRRSPVTPPEEWPARPDWRWTVDTPQDLAMARQAFEIFGLEAVRIGYPDMVARLEAHPDCLSLNCGVSQKPLEAG
ncbi:MAG: NTP transferase domain-containing protein [Proteobacteria bacterium]|nr:NTP transferase domain-containing protein [Pseudomonadota bacterium]